MRKFVLKPKVELNILNSFGANIYFCRPNSLAENLDRMWQNTLEEHFGRTIWKNVLAECFVRTFWQNTMAERFGLWSFSDLESVALLS